MFAVLCSYDASSIRQQTEIETYKLRHVVFL